jgi:hypothetical protein
MTNDKIKPGRQFHRNQVQIGRQDAFHVPSILVTSEHSLNPSDSVQLTDDHTRVVPCDKGDRHAIVDPFLDTPTNLDRAFWVFLVPDMITDLTHNFSLDLPETTPTEYFSDQGYADEGSESGECSGC